MDQQAVREAVKRLVGERGESYASLSRVLGRNSAYIQQFVTRGSPSRLDEGDRKLLARYLGVSERELGGPEDQPDLSRMVRVLRLTVEAAAGAGRVVEGEEAVGAYAFDPRWLRAISRARTADLSIISVSGDSMHPTLADGDDVLVDRSDGGERLRDGVYVLRRDDSLMVKRIALAPTSTTLTISSDNPAYPSWRDCPLDSVIVVGRVVWAGRKIG